MSLGLILIESRILPVLLSYCCSNTLSQIQRFKTRQIHYPTVLEVRNPKWILRGINRTAFLLEALGENLLSVSLPFPADRGPLLVAPSPIFRTHYSNLRFHHPISFSDSYSIASPRNL